MPTSIASVMFTLDQSINKLALVQFTLDEHNHQVLVNMNVPNEIINFFQQQLNDGVRAAENQDVAQSICATFERIFRVISPVNNNNEEFHENLVVMIINGASALDDDPLAAAKAFNIRGITLAVVAAAIPAYEVYNYYCTLAENTGGAYMLLADAPAILEGVILSAINGEDRLRQAFKHIRPANVPIIVNHIDEVNEQEPQSDGDGEFVFDLDLS